MDHQPVSRQPLPVDRGRREPPLLLLLVLAAIALLSERLARIRPVVLGAVAFVAIVAVALVGSMALRAASGPVASPVAAVDASAPDAPTPSPPVATTDAPALPAPVATLPAGLPATTTAPPPTAAAPATATAVPVTPTAALPSPSAIAQPATPRGTTVIPILMYHYVRVVTDPKDTIGINLSVKPELFAQQMRYLAENGYTTLTMSDVYAILAGRQPLPPKPIALTFDDGYRDFYTAAWPVLRQYNFKATSYVVSGFIDADPYMTWAMIKDLDASGQIEIGVHTINHADLAALSQARRWQEISGSKAAIERGLGHPVTAFCYPAGKYDAGVIELVRKAGFLTATTVEFGSKQSLQWAFELPRVRVNGPDSLAAWIGKLP